jgi:hypothetical protein
MLQLRHSGTLSKILSQPPRKGSKGKGKGKGKNGKGAWTKGKGSTRSVEYDEEEEEEEEEEEGDGNDIGGIWQIAGSRGTTKWGKSSCQCGKYRCEKRANGREDSVNTWEVLRIHDDEESEQGEILHMGRGEGDWEEVKITVDSGAVDTVGPRTLGKGIPLVETEASKQGKYYRAANDTKIAIHGKKNICGYTAEGTKIGIDVQIADVKKTLGSVRRICEAGNRVVFDEDGSYVENKSSGERTALIT